MASSAPDIAEHFKGYQNEISQTVATVAGAARVESPRVPAGFVWKIDTATVAGAGVAGARVNLYRGNVADDTFAGTVLLGATDPAAVFDSDAPAWLRSGDKMIATVAGGAAGDVVLSLWFRLYELRQVPPPAPPARTAAGEPTGYPDQHDGGMAADAPEPDALRARDPLGNTYGGPPADGRPLLTETGELPGVAFPAGGGF